MNKHNEKNIPAVIAFMVALASGPFLLGFALTEDLPSYISLLISIYIASTVAVWWFENGRGKHN